MFISPGICFESLNVLNQHEDQLKTAVIVSFWSIELEEFESSKPGKIGSYAKKISRTIATTLPTVVAIKFTTSLFIHRIPRKNSVRVPQ